MGRTYYLPYSEGRYMRKSSSDDESQRYLFYSSSREQPTAFSFSSSSISIRNLTKKSESATFLKFDGDKNFGHTVDRKTNENVERSVQLDRGKPLPTDHTFLIKRNQKVRRGIWKVSVSTSTDNLPLATVERATSTEKPNIVNTGTQSDINVPKYCGDCKALNWDDVLKQEIIERLYKMPAPGSGHRKKMDEDKGRLSGVIGSQKRASCSISSIPTISVKTVRNQTVFVGDQVITRGHIRGRSCGQRFFSRIGRCLTCNCGQ